MMHAYRHLHSIAATLVLQCCVVTAHSQPTSEFGQCERSLHDELNRFREARDVERHELLRGLYPRRDCPETVVLMLGEIMADTALDDISRWTAAFRINLMTGYRRPIYAPPGNDPAALDYAVRATLVAYLEPGQRYPFVDMAIPAILATVEAGETESWHYQPRSEAVKALATLGLREAIHPLERLLSGAEESEFHNMVKLALAALYLKHEIPEEQRVDIGLDLGAEGR